MEKQRIFDIQTNNPNPTEELKIQLETDSGERSFSILDTGIGLTREQLIENIGTIASSGTKKFSDLLRKAEEQGNSVDNLIGQFGVGFYATFVVAHKVELYTKSDESDVALYWCSDGEGDFTISEITNDLPFSRGTLIKLHLREEFEKYARETEVTSCIKKFSQFTK